MLIHPLLPRPLLAALTLLFLVAAACADEIYFTEVVTDPQSDHSESSGGNGAPYDDQPGTGTVSSTDEWLELYNAGTSTVDLTGFTLAFIDSTPSSYVFGTTTAGTLLFGGSSTLDAFAPGDFLVLGNPPGALNNSITLELLDPDGMLWDQWVVGDANATGTADEALARSPIGLFEAQTSISPLANASVFLDLDDGSTGGGGGTGGGGDPEPVPEPGSAALLGAIAAGWYLARRRTARRATSRTRSDTRRRTSDPVQATAEASGCPGLPGAPAGNA
jgi:hypothetical protein